MSVFRPRLVALLAAAIAAGTLSTLVQVALWVVFTESWAVLLARDARLAAALVLGSRVLPPPATFDATVMATATLVHGALSLAYVALLAPLLTRRSAAAAAAIGAVFGAGLYIVNLYGFTVLFPWFAVARDWITLAAHIAFGASAAVVYRAVAT